MNKRYRHHHSTPLFSKPVLALFCLALFSGTSCFAAPADVRQGNAYKTIKLVQNCGSGASPGNIYIKKLIEHAFSYSSATVSIEMLEKKCSHARQKGLIKSGKSDFFWAATTSEYEQELIPIRIPIYKGLLGYRISLIKAENVGEFDAIESFDQLSQLRFGQGEGWADTLVLQHAGLNVIQSTDIWNLYSMLQADRFDMFPRGIMEPWKEMADLSELNFSVDTHFMFAYPMPAYIFVTPTRPELATMIEDGLRKAIDDGSFDKIFYSDPQVKQALLLTNAHKRKVFYLTNPDLPKATPLESSKLWLDITKFTEIELEKLASEP